MTDEKGFKRTKVDVGHALTKAGLSAIPFVGGPVAELMNLIWEPALSKRRDGWLIGLAENLQLLTEKVEGFKLEDLSQNETFITTTIQASQAAIRTHQKEKLNALRNAVLNSALNTNLNDEIQLLCLSLVERLTVSHILILEYFSTCERGISVSINNKENKSVYEMIASNLYGIAHKSGILYPLVDIEARRNPNRTKEFMRIIINDLESLGLIQTGTPESLMTYNRYHTYIKSIGEELLRFISYPPELLKKDKL
jgi:hypothetical protein